MPRGPLPSRCYLLSASSARASGLLKEKQFSSSTSDARALATSGGGGGGGALAGCAAQGPSAEPSAEVPDDAPQPMHALCNYCGG